MFRIGFSAGVIFSLFEASRGKSVENARSEICAKGRRLNKWKRNTHEYIVPLACILHSSRLSVRLKNAKGSGAMGRRTNERKNEKRHENNVPLACFSLRVFRSSVQKMAVALPQAIKTFKFLA